MRVSTRAASLVLAAALIAPFLGCAGKSKVQLEMTRETVLISPEIESVTLDPAGRVDTREAARTIRVTVAGDPGLTATFDVEGRATGQPMQETQPGVYTGSFTVPKGESSEIQVVGHLVDPESGASQQQRAAVPLTAWVSPAPAPVVRCTPEMVAEFDARLRELTVYYDFDHWEMSDADKQRLRQQQEVFASHPLCSIYVLGYSDDVGSPEYNLRLSQIRAIHAGSYLITLGVDKNRLKEFFLGEQYPAVAADTPEARARNRRVEFRALNPH